MNAILEARDMLRELTPLLTDCGELCNHACCKMDRDAGGLVWLWPGEEDTDMPWAETLFTHLPVTGLDVEAVRCAVRPRGSPVSLPPVPAGALLFGKEADVGRAHGSPRVDALPAVQLRHPRPKPRLRESRARRRAPARAESRKRSLPAGHRPRRGRIPLLAVTQIIFPICVSTIMGLPSCNYAKRAGERFFMHSPARRRPHLQKALRVRIVEMSRSFFRRRLYETRGRTFSMRSPARPIHYSPFAASDERNACSSADAMPSAVMPMALCTSMTALRVAESKVPISASGAFR